MKLRKPHKKKRILILSKEYVVELSTLVEIEGDFFFYRVLQLSKFQYYTMTLNILRNTYPSRKLNKRHYKLNKSLVCKLQLLQSFD